MFRTQSNEDTFISVFARIAVALEKIAAGHPAPSEPQDPQASFYRVLQLVKEPNQFINAIKEFRALTGAGLREAKETCEFLRDRRF